MSILWSFFLYVSTGLFWLVAGISIFRAFKCVSGTNEKIRTHETVAMVLKKVNHGEKQ